MDSAALAIVIFFCILIIGAYAVGYHIGQTDVFQELATRCPEGSQFVKETLSCVITIEVQR